MNKTELVAAIADSTELSRKDVEAVVKSFTEVVSDELKKKGKASYAPRFKAGKALKDLVNEK